MNLVYWKINEEISQNTSQRDKTMGNMKEKAKDMENRMIRSSRHLTAFLGGKREKAGRSNVGSDNNYIFQIEYVR